MPIYDLRCRDCGNAREVQTDYATATSLELVCTACGGAMTKVPSRVAVVSSLGSAAPSSSTTLPGTAAEPAAERVGYRRADEGGARRPDVDRPTTTDERGTRGG